ncbi:MAG: tripartite tricarboxylate transporter TctB family protein [Pseudomonadota bacterium]
MIRRLHLQSYWSAELAAPVFIGFLGALMFALALTQPAWLDGRIGPGLFARWLSAAAIFMSVIWFVVALLQHAPAHDAARVTGEAPSLLPGLGLLSGVVAFAIAMPVVGMVAACALTACVVSLGAGERGWTPNTLSALSGAGAALAVGLTLLPPGARLWPPGF